MYSSRPPPFQPPAPPPSNVGKIVVVVGIVLGSLALVGAIIVAEIHQASRDPADDMRRTNDVAANLFALAPLAMAPPVGVTDKCPDEVRTPNASDGGRPTGLEVIDANELTRFAPLDSGIDRFAWEKRSPWHFTNHDIEKLTPWEDPRFNQQAAQSATVAEGFASGYVVVVQTISIIEPKVDRALIGDDAFTPGHFLGRALLFDLERHKLICQTQFEAQSSDNVKWKTRDSYADKAVHDNLEVNVVNGAYAAAKRMAPALGW